MRKKENKRIYGKVMPWAAGLLLAVGVAVGGWAYLARQWKADERFTVIEFEKNGAKVWSFDPQTKLGVEVLLPSNLEVEGANGRARWLVGVLPRVEQLMHKPGWAAKSLSGYLGVPYVAQKNQVRGWDAWRWNRATREGTWTKISAVDVDVLEPSRSVDGLDYYVVGSRWQTMAKKWFLQAGLQKEGKSVEIVNTTGTAGMGTRAARLIETAGVKVEAITVGERMVGQCLLVVGKGGEKLQTTKFILANFGCRLEINPRYLESQMKLELGSDYEQEWLGWLGLDFFG